MIKRKINIIFLIIFITNFCLIINCAKEKESRMKPEQEVRQKVGFEANIHEIEDIVYNKEKEMDWRTVYHTTVNLRNLKDKRTEEAFLKLLERKEPIRLREGSDFPGAMSPLNMLKALAMESLRDTGGKNYLKEFYKIYQETDERILREMAMEHILALGGNVPEL